jgi:hypothetical protein
VVNVEHDRDEWRERNLADVVLAFVRAVKDLSPLTMRGVADARSPERDDG